MELLDFLDHSVLKSLVQSDEDAFTDNGSVEIRCQDERVVKWLTDWDCGARVHGDFNGSYEAFSLSQVGPLLQFQGGVLLE